MAEQKRRIIIALEGGLVQSISVEGIDLEGLEAYVIDYDAEGSEDGVAGPVDPDFPNQPSTCFLGDWTGAVTPPAENVREWLDEQAALA
ncbi:MAG: hypothetical protein ACOZHQ_09540 [Thermodesulfobacteriota bacterium]